MSAHREPAKECRGVSEPRDPAGRPEAPRLRNRPEAGAASRWTAHSIEPLAGEWDDLASRVGASPFVRPGWVAAWWRAFGAGSLEIRTVRRGGRLAAVLPVARRFGALSSVTNYHTPQSGLLAEDWSAAEELARGLFTGGPRRVSLTSLSADGASMTAFRRAAEETDYRYAIRPFQTSPYLDIAGALAEYESRLSRSLVADLRRSRLRLDRQGSTAVEIAVGGERLERQLEEAFAVEASGWKGARRTAILSHPATRAFYTEVARWAAARGTLRIFLLRLDGRALAMYYALQEEGTCHLLKGGYAPAYRRFSPGSLLMHSVVSHCFAAGVSRLELHGHAEPYKLRWARAADERKRFEAFPPTPAGLLAWTAVARGRPAVKRLLAARCASKRSGHEGSRGRRWSRTE